VKTIQVLAIAAASWVGLLGCSDGGSSSGGAADGEPGVDAPQSDGGEGDGGADAAPDADAPNGDAGEGGAADGGVDGAAGDAAVAEDADDNTDDDALDGGGSPGTEPSVGLTQATIPGPDGVELPVFVWYPAQAPQGDASLYVYLGLETSEAYVDTPAAPGSYPLVLFSHGYGAVAVQSFSICEAWAKAGYIVAAPDHVGNTFFDGGLSTNSADPEVLASLALRRPLDLGAVYDAVVGWNTDEDHPLFGAVDVNSVMVSGHSFGGFTALAVAGAQADPAFAAEACASGNAPSQFCGVLEDFDPVLTPLAPTNLPPIRAAIPMAPGGYVVFGPTGLASVSAPTLVLAGDLDNVTPLDTEMEPIYSASPGPKALAVFNRGNHYTFSDLCTVESLTALSPFLASQCNPQFYLDAQVGIALTIELSLLWFDAYGKGDASALQALGAPAALEGEWPGILELSVE
jgi:predicted dienelactone hydrolase